MNGHLIVVRPGPMTTVQDLGRSGYQHVGMPVAGALDAIALRLANALVGNPQGMAGLELRFQGPELAVAAETVRIAVAGPVRLELAGEPARELAPWRSHRLTTGQLLRVGPVRAGAVAYVAIEGGLALPPVLGSLATYARASLGGLDGRALQVGDRLPLAQPAAGARDELALPAPPDYGSGPLRVVLGPQDDYFTREALATFLGAAYTVSREADRMGLRLDGPKLAHAKGADIASDGIATGSIQVPGNGLPILLLADHQTAGGYPKIATVVSADLPRAGHLLPGQTVRFGAVTVAEAEAIRRAQEAMLVRLIAGMRGAPVVGGIDLEALHRENLISGVVDSLAAPPASGE